MMPFPGRHFGKLSTGNGDTLLQKFKTQKTGIPVTACRHDHHIPT